MKKAKGILLVLFSVVIVALGILLSVRIVDTSSGTEQSEDLLSYFIHVVRENHIKVGNEPDEVKRTSQGTPIADAYKFKGIDRIETPNSSCFSEAGYDRGTGTLLVTFRDSGVSYVYDEVPLYVWNDFISAESMGTFYNSEIKDLYDYARLE